ncbi:MAG: tetratricopeptide repeat protein [Muribaculaceae bacterium]
MKRITLMAIALGVAACATAQMSVVKDAQRAAKEGQPFSEVVGIITPALTNPETAGSSDTWMVPGKAAYDQYDKLVANKQLHMFKNAQDTINQDMLLVPAYEYYMKALAVDTIIDKKGKPKTKNSKKILDTFVGHLNDYYMAGAELYNFQKYDDAFKAFGIFIDLTQMPQLKKSLASNPMAADSIVSSTAFNQGIAAWQVERFDDAIGAFMNAIKLGYNKKQVYDYAMAVAQAAGKNDTLFMIAQEALPLYGKEDTQYIRQITNHYLQSKDYDNAYKAINQAIEQDPANPQYYVVKGIISEYSGDLDAATQSYEKAYNLDNSNAEAAYNYGRALYEKASKLSENAPTTQAEYEIYLNEKIKPFLEHSIVLLEEAYQLNPDNKDVLLYLENAYYSLGNNKMYEDVQKRKKY